MSLLRIVINSTAFVLLLLAALFVYPLYWPASILFVLSAFDQLEDVYYAVRKKRLLPRWLKPIDIFFEVVLALFGVIIAVASFYYAPLFVHSYMLWGLAVLGAIISISAISDIAEWYTTAHTIVHHYHRKFVKHRS